MMKFKTLYIFFLFSLLIGCGVNDSNSDHKKELSIEDLDRGFTTDFDEDLSVIKQNFKRINSNKKWTVIDSINLYESTEGGVAKFYFANKQLEKIVAIYYGETGKLIYEFYLLNNKLSFVYLKEFIYNKPIYWQVDDDQERFDIDKSKINEKRYYFSNGNLVCFFDSKKAKTYLSRKHLNNLQVEIEKTYNNLVEASNKQTVN